MPIDIVRGAIKNTVASQQLVDAIKKFQDEFNGTLFLSYPLSADKEQNIITIDALLVTKEKGLFAFIFDLTDNYEDDQDKVYYQITSNLNKYDSLRKGRKLAIEPVIVTLCGEDNHPESNETHLYNSCHEIASTIKQSDDFDASYYEKLVEALQKLSSIKAKNNRKNVKKEGSKGYIIKNIEREIANLDRWQKNAALEIADGPQRIRGLAGSGKTIVLALKAAYLHAQYPEWNIVVTYYSRALNQQFNELISGFYYEYTGENPNWDKLRIMHSWGTSSEEGVYSFACEEIGIVPKNYSNATVQFGRKLAFEGVCNELLNTYQDTDKNIFDIILIDEAQDMPASFFKICYKLAKHPKRVVFAYDELQNLAGNNMPTIKEMFGVNSDGNANVVLNNDENSVKQDIVLPICYRNSSWILSLAHALGFGVYREKELVQLFADFKLWDAIGYTVVSGDLGYGKEVTLQRKSDSEPAYFKEYLNPEDAIIIESFESKHEQYIWIADQIKKNITEDELNPDDILVIFPDPYYAKSDYFLFSQYLVRLGIDSNLVGVGTNRDVFRKNGEITCTHIYRAKGNEAPMVYIVNSDYCADEIELRKARNMLFTAITRSRAWVRICGVSPKMDIIKSEALKCIENGYKLSFKIPTQDELERINVLYRDRSDQELSNIKKAAELAKNLSQLLSSGVEAQAIPGLEVLMNNLSNAKDTYE